MLRELETTSWEREGNGSEGLENEKGKEEQNLEFGKVKCAVVVGGGDDDDDDMEAMDGCVSVMFEAQCMCVMMREKERKGE